jgi:hypothetical protein
LAPLKTTRKAAEIGFELRGQVGFLHVGWVHVLWQELAALNLMLSSVSAVRFHKSLD